MPKTADNPLPESTTWYANSPSPLVKGRWGCLFVEPIDDLANYDISVRKNRILLMKAPMLIQAMKMVAGTNNSLPSFLHALFMVFRPILKWRWSLHS